MSVIRIWVAPPADLSRLLRAVYAGCGLSPGSVREAVLAGEPVYEAELFNADFAEVAADLRGLVAALRSSEVAFTIREFEDQISAEVLDNILELGLRRFRGG